MICQNYSHKRHRAGNWILALYKCIIIIIIIIISVKGNSSKHVIHDKLGTIPSKSKSILFTNSDLNSVLKCLKRGKACGVDGLAAEHFIYAHIITHVFLSLLINALFTLGMDSYQMILRKPPMVPIIENKTGDTSDKTTTVRFPWSLPHLKYLKFVYLKFYKCTLLHIITSLDLKQNTQLTCVFYGKKHYQVLHWT